MVKDEFRKTTDTFSENDEKAVDANIAPPGVVLDAPADAGSKKRAREDDDEAEEQGSTKKVDSKVES